MADQLTMCDLKVSLATLQHTLVPMMASVATLVKKIVDKFRWLENVDDMNKDYTQETDEDRDRNLIGSLLEDDVKDGLFDNRTRKDLQTVKPKQSSEVNDWVNAQNEVTNQYFDANPIYEQVKKQY